MFTNLIVAVISQHVRISHHHVVHLKYMQVLFVDYTSVRLGGGEDRPTQ